MIPLHDRLQARLKQTESGCIEWQGYRNSDGYGLVGRGGRGEGLVKTHRAAWEIANGPIPEGMHVLHRCDNPPCCNVEHLFLGDQAANMRDMNAKGRCVAGAARLTTEQVDAMRAMRAAGALHREIAVAFGVSKQHVGAILAGKHWRSGETPVTVHVVTATMAPTPKPRAA